MGGGITRPRNGPIGVNGSRIARIVTARVVKINGLLAWLFQNGVCWVLMTKTTSDWVLMDSMNHAVWKSGGEAWNTNIMTPKVR